MLKMDLTHENEIKRIVDTILTAVPALAIYIFGSFASGTATNDSDYDFYVIVPDGLQPIEVTWKITGSIPREIRKTRSIDMLVGTESKFNKLKDVLGFIENQVAQTGVRLYG